MTNAPDRSQHVVAWIVLGIVVAVLAVACFFIGTTERQSRAEGLSREADTKSIHAAQTTSGLVEQERTVKARSIKNCQALQQFIASNFETAAEANANAERIAASDDRLAAEFYRARDPRIAHIFVDRVAWDKVGAHIARRASAELRPILKDTCDLPVSLER